MTNTPDLREVKSAPSLTVRFQLNRWMRRLRFWWWPEGADSRRERAQWLMAHGCPTWNVARLASYLQSMDENSTWLITDIEKAEMERLTAAFNEGRLGVDSDELYKWVWTR